MLKRIAAVGIALAGFALGSSSSSAQTGNNSLEERKLPMRFTWVACQPNCRGWIGAVGVVTAETPRAFEDFASTRQLDGAAIVLDSSGGSVNDAIALGRRWRALGLKTSVGMTVETQTPTGIRTSIAPEAYCESMCVFMLLAGTARYVPAAAQVRVHQIWMGDRADDPKASTYSAQDMTIVERDIGRLAKYTFDMGGTGDLLSLALNVAPWEDLHRLSPAELQLTNLITTETIADLLPEPGSIDRAVAEAAPKRASVADNTPKPMQDRFVSTKTDSERLLKSKSTQVAESLPTGGLVVPATQPQH
jgi:hypothetical protein